jgi:hypothetical protein
VSAAHNGGHACPSKRSVQRQRLAARTGRKCTRSTGWQLRERTTPALVRVWSKAYRRSLRDALERR